MKHFIVSYESNNVHQSLIVNARNIDEAENFFRESDTDAVLYGIREKTDITEEMNKGMPILTA